MGKWSPYGAAENIETDISVVILSVIDLFDQQNTYAQKTSSNLVTSLRLTFLFAATFWSACASDDEIELFLASC